MPIFLLLLGLILSWPLAAEPERRYVVAFAQDTLENDWRMAQMRELQAAFAAYPFIEFVYSDGQGQTARQIQNIEDFLYRKVDLLITSPRDAEALAPVVERVYQAGIPVILLTRRVASEYYTSFIHPDDLQIARQAGEYLARRLNGKGRVLMLQGVPSATTAQQRSQGFLEVLANYPEITVTTRVGNYLRNEALRETAALLDNGQRFEAIYAQSDSMASGARLALRKAGIDPGQIEIVGIDYIAEAREAIRLGEQKLSFTYPTCAEAGAELALRILRGEKVPREVVVESRRVNAANVERIAPIF
jgi:ribose transport system substrate-binding protein